MKKSMCFGTFDILHPGHLFLFKEAKKFADYLVVVVARDKNSELIKGKKPVNSELSRLDKVKSVSIVNKAVLGNESDLIKIIEDEKPDFVCLGYDQEISEKKLKKRLEQRLLHPVITRINSYMPNIYKSSLLRKNEN